MSTNNRKKSTKKSTKKVEKDPDKKGEDKVVSDKMKKTPSLKKKSSQKKSASSEKGKKKPISESQQKEPPEKSIHPLQKQKSLETDQNKSSSEPSETDPFKTLAGLDENLQKLITPEEREKMEENLALVTEYLKKIGIVDMNIDHEKLLIAVPFDYEEFTFLSHIVLSPEWILIKTSIFEIEHLSEVAIINLFAEVLKGNFILNSVVYALDPENKSIWAQSDLAIPCDFKTFKLNYFSIVFAIDYFMKNIASKIDVELRSTTDREEFKKNPENLYI